MFSLPGQMGFRLLQHLRPSVSNLHLSRPFFTWNTGLLAQTTPMVPLAGSVRFETVLSSVLRTRGQQLGGSQFCFSSLSLSLLLSDRALSRVCGYSSSSRQQECLGQTGSQASMAGQAGGGRQAGRQDVVVVQRVRESSGGGSPEELRLWKPTGLV